MIKKHVYVQFTGRLAGAAIAAVVISAVLVAAPPSVSAQVRAQQPMNYPVPGSSQQPEAPSLQLPPLPAATPITPNGDVVEDVIARVNDRIITRTEFERARKQLVEEARQQNAPQDALDDKLQNLLRDMIDQQLLLSKGKELGITGDAETMRRLDDIRKQNHLDSMEALQKAAEQQGVSFEDFKEQIRNSIITNQVVQSEVGRHLNLTQTQEQQYYDAHKQDFEVPEQVHLSEILITTPENATNAQLSAAQQKADAVEAELKAGKNFAGVAKASSGGPTAAAGGDLGDFKRGTLGDVLEKATFSLPVGAFTAPIRTRQGFVILHVDAHQKAGVPPLQDVERKVQEAIYFQQLQPALRAYLTTARENAYIDIKPGFVDTGSSQHETKPVFTAYAPPAVKKKVLKKQRVEQEKARMAKEQLAAAREKLAEKQAEKAAKQSGGGSVQATSHHVKRHKIRREKIRYGQAPRKSLPAASTQTAETTGSAMEGQTAGAALAPADSTTTISTGTGFDENSTDALAPKVGPQRKSRFSDREKVHEEKSAEEKLTRAEEKAKARPVAATPQESAEEKHQAAPLGLNGNTGKHKKKKKKHVKGETKERLQEKTKPVETAPTIAPTVNPALGGSPAVPVPAKPSAPSSPAGSTQQ